MIFQNVKLVINKLINKANKANLVDNNKESFMYPNVARLRNMSYAFTIHYDVDVDFYMSEPCDCQEQ